MKAEVVRRFSLRADPLHELVEPGFSDSYTTSQQNRSDVFFERQHLSCGLGSRCRKRYGGMEKGSGLMSLLGWLDLKTSTVAILRKCLTLSGTFQALLGLLCPARAEPTSQCAK